MKSNKKELTEENENLTGLFEVLIKIDKRLEKEKEGEKKERQDG